MVPILGQLEGPLGKAETTMAQSHRDGLFEVVEYSIGWNVKGCSSAAISKPLRRKVNNPRIAELLSWRYALCLLKGLRRVSRIARTGE